MKKKWVYKLIEILTLVLPMSVYLLVSALIFNIQPDIIVGGTTEQVEVVLVNESQYIIALDDDVTFNGQVEKIGESYGLFLGDDYIVKFDNGYFTFSEQWDNVKDKGSQEQESKGGKISFTTAVSIFAIVIVALIIFNKMQFQKKYPRLATLLALVVGTLILTGIHFIIDNILYVFIVATLSWAAYTIEHLVFKNMITTAQGEKATSELTAILNEALKGIK